MWDGYRICTCAVFPPPRVIELHKLGRICTVFVSHMCLLCWNKPMNAINQNMKSYFDEDTCPDPKYLSSQCNYACLCSAQTKKKKKTSEGTINLGDFTQMSLAQQLLVSRCLLSTPKHEQLRNSMDTISSHFVKLCLSRYYISFHGFSFMNLLNVEWK